MARQKVNNYALGTPASILRMSIWTSAAEKSLFVISNLAKIGKAGVTFEKTFE